MHPNRMSQKIGTQGKRWILGPKTSMHLKVRTSAKILQVPEDKARWIIQYVLQLVSNRKMVRSLESEERTNNKMKSQSPGRPQEVRERKIKKEKKKKAGERIRPRL